MNADVSAILKAVPKTEMHLHIEGALPFALLRKAFEGKHETPPPFWRDDYRFKDFEEFDRELLGMVCPYFNSPERYFEAASSVFANLYEKGVRYAEVSFASGIVQFCGVPGAEIAEAIAKAAPLGMDVKIFFGIHHDGRPQSMEKIFEDSFSWKYLNGADLHGDERAPLEAWTADYWRAMRKSGRHTKAHAGELCGPQFIRRVIEELGVRQIEHGVRAIEDASLVQELVAEKIVLDVCPTSNVKLGVAQSYAAHPLRALINAGVLCTLNSDDPVIFGGDILDEYQVLTDRMGFTLEECFGIVENGWRAAKLDENTKRAALQKVAEIKKSYNLS